MVNREIEIEAKSSPDITPPSQSQKSDRSILLAAKGGSVTFAGSIFAFGSRFVIGLILARWLGAEQLGLYSLALSTLTIATGLAGLGLAPALVRYISIFARRKETAKLWGTLQVGFGLSMIASLGIGIGLFALAPLIAERIFDETRLVPLLRLGGLVIPLSVLGDLLASATQGFKKMQYTVIAQNIAQPMVRIVLLVAVALVIGLNAANVMVIHLSTMAVVFGLLIYYLNRLFSLRRPLNTAQRNPKQVLGFSLPVYGTNLIKIFGGNIQTLLLGAYQAITTVGVFAVTDKVNMIGRMFHLAIVTTSAPLVSELYDQGKKEQLARFYQTMTKWTFTVNLPLFLVLQLFPGAILSIFGKEYVGGATALTILAWGSLVNSATGICGVIIDMTGKTGLKLINVIMAFSITVGLNLLLIPKWSIVGAAVATTAAIVIVNLLRLIEVFVLYRLSPYNISFLKPVIAGSVSLAAVWVIGQLFSNQVSLVYVVLNILILFTLYVGVILLLGLSEEDRKVLARIIGRLRTRFGLERYFPG